MKWPTSASAPLLALAGSLAVTATIIALVFAPMHLTTSGVYSTKQRAIYVTVTTLLATIFTALVSAQIQKLLLRQVDSDLAASPSDIEGLNRRWRTVLGIGSLADRTRNILIGVVYLFTGLITTAIVASFTPNTSTRSFPYSLGIPLGPNICVGVIPLAQNSGGDYYWNLGNGSVFYIPANAGSCPTRQAVTLAANINIINPNTFAYADMGVAVHASAVGTPITVYSSLPETAPEFNALFSVYGANIVSTTQCVPVMRQNPISCRPGGTVNVDDSLQQVTAVSADGRCSYTESFLLSITQNSVMVKKMCAHDDVGQGTIVIGATMAYANNLARSIGDMSAAANTSLATYAVSCAVNTRDVFEYRTVTLGLQNSNTTESSYARSLIGQEPCSPSSPELSSIGDVLFATSAAANWQLLFQNDGIDGWFDTICQLTLGDTTGRKPPWAFSNSVNALEDALGLTSALVASRTALVGSKINSSTIDVNGTVLVIASRIGGGRTFALAFAIPPAAAAAVLLYLMTTTPLSEAVRYSTSKLGDLIAFGESLRTRPDSTYASQYRPQKWSYASGSAQPSHVAQSQDWSDVQHIHLTSLT